MRALLDTHALLWFLLDDPKLPKVAKGIIADGGNYIAVSVSVGPTKEAQQFAGRVPACIGWNPTLSAPQR